MIKSLVLQNRGISYMLIASFLFALMGGIAKELSNSMSSLEITFFRNFLGIFFILFTLLKSPIKQTGGKPFLLFFRGFIGFIALLFFFYNISKIPLAEAITFSKTSPIFTAIFAYIFLKEKLSLKAWIAIFIGFIGIVFIIKPSFEGISIYYIYGLLSGICAGLAYTSIRELKDYYDTRVIVLSFMIAGTLFPLIFMIISEFYMINSMDFIFAKFVMPSFGDSILIAFLAIFATISQLLMTKAYFYEKAGVIGTIGYSNIAFSFMIGLILGDSFLEIGTIFGILLIVISGIGVMKEKGIKG